MSGVEAAGLMAAAVDATRGDSVSEISEDSDPSRPASSLTLRLRLLLELAAVPFPFPEPGGLPGPRPEGGGFGLPLPGGLPGPRLRVAGLSPPVVDPPGAGVLGADEAFDAFAAAAALETCRPGAYPALTLTIALLLDAAFDLFVPVVLADGVDGKRAAGLTASGRTSNRALSSF